MCLPDIIHPHIWHSPHSARMETTYYLRKLLHILHIFGLIRLPNFHQEDWKMSLHRIYWFSVHCAFILGGTSNIISLIAYSSRNIPEFLQRLFEIVSFSGYYLETIQLNQKLPHFLALLEKLDHLSYKKGDKLLTEYKRKEKIVCIGFFIIMTNTFFCKYILQ